MQNIALNQLLFVTVSLNHFLESAYFEVGSVPDGHLKFFFFRQLSMVGCLTGLVIISVQEFLPSIKPW